MRLGVVLVFCVVLLGGCMNAPGKLPARERLAPAISITLPAAVPFEGDVAAAQLIEVRRDGRRHRFEAFVEGGEGRFALAMMLPSGPSIMVIEWREGALRIRRGVAPASLEAKRILVDFMLVYAPEPALRAAISGGDLVFSGSGARRIFRNGELLIEAVAPTGNPWQGEARLTNFVYDYELIITSRARGAQ